MAERQYQIRGTPLDNSAYAQDASPGFFEEMDAQLKQSWWYQTAAAQRRYNLPAEEGYDPFEHMKGYEQYADDFLQTRSTAEAELLKKQIAENLADEEEISRSSWKLPLLGRFGFSWPGLAAGVADPLNVIPVPLVSGVGFARGVLKAGAAAGAMAAGAEAIRAEVSPTVDQGSVAFAMGASFLTAGILGGASGKLGPHIARAAKSLIKDERGTIETAARGIVNGIAENEYGNVAHKVDFQEEGYAVERGATGERHADGSYRPVAVAERDVEATKPPTGHVRIYRAENSLDNELTHPGPDWLREGYFQSTGAKAYGRWFTADPEALAWYVKDAGDHPVVKHLDIPEDELEQYRVSNIKETADGLHPGQFSRDPANEFFVPPELAAKRVVAETKRERFIKLDEAAIKTQYQPDGRLAPGTGGVTPLPENSLRNEDEAVTFSVLRELWSTHLKPREGETPEAYSSRLNEATLKELHASRVANDPAGVMGPYLDKLNFSPVAKAIRLFKKDNVLTSIPLRIAGDYGWAVRANKFGYKTPPSVLIRAAKYYGNFAEIKGEIDAHFNEAIRGASTGGDSMSFGGQNLETSWLRVKQGVKSVTSKGEEVLTYDVFRRMVGQAVYDSGDFSVKGIRVHPQARLAAVKISHALRGIERTMLELGMFEDQHALKRDLDFWSGVRTDLETETERLGWMLGRAEENTNTFTPAQRSYLAGLEARWRDAGERIEGIKTRQSELARPHTFGENENYWPRFFDCDAILADREAFTRLVAEWYRRTGDADGALHRAEETVARILKEDVEDLGFDHPHLSGLGARHLYSRRLDMPNSFELDGVKLADFIQNDSLSVLESYFHRVGTAIEMHRSFGDFTLDRLKADLHKHFAQHYVVPKDASKSLTFRTAKGSSYVVGKAGRTTRNKAARPEHPGEHGPQPESERTFYLSKQDAQALGSEFQVQGGPKRTIDFLPDGRVGIKYLDGKDKGKFEARTVVSPIDKPAIGLTPVELWKKGTKAHFGNDISSVTDIQTKGEKFDGPRFAKRKEAFEEYLRHIDNLRDWMLGRLNRTDPWRWDNRVSRDIRAWTTMAYLGKAVVASLVEAGRVVQTQGVLNAFRVPLSALSGDLPRLSQQINWMRKESGEALEMVRDHNILRHVEETSSTGYGGTAFERWLQNRLPGFFKLTLLTQWTVAIKQYAMLTAQHAILHDASVVSSAKRAGTAVPEQTAFRLAAMGIGDREALLLAEMPFETLTGGSLLLPAVHKWTGPEGERATRVLMDAISGESRRTVVTPSVADKSTLFSGVLTRRGEHMFETGLFTLPLQFMSFAIGAHTKITTSMLQGRDRSVMMGLVAMYGIGMMIDYLKSPGYAWEQKPLEEKLLRAYELAGIGGYWFGDINRSIENVSGDTLGVRPLLGMDPMMGKQNRGTQMLDGLGPGPDLIRGLYSAFSDPELLATRRGALIRSAVIYNNVWWWAKLTKKLDRPLGDAIPEGE